MNKDWVVRALKTFWQAALSALIVNAEQIVALVPEGWEAIKPVLLSAAIGALAAGLSALYNGVIKPHLIVSTEVTEVTKLTEVTEIIDVTEETEGDEE